MENIKVYLLNIDEVNAYVDKNYFREEFGGEFLESVENLLEEDCRKIIDASRDRRQTSHCQLIRCNNLTRAKAWISFIQSFCYEKIQRAIH